MNKAKRFSLESANELVREGSYREAANAFRELLRARPGYLAYEQGYALALRRLGERNCTQMQAPTTCSLDSIHPKSKAIDTDPAPLFAVVTPVLNGATFLEITLNSVLNQAGNFFVDYFVKDAGSTDTTLTILRSYSQRIATGNFPLHCNGVRFRVESSPDNGLYDAVAHGFGVTQQRTKPTDILTYINADDVLAEDAFRIAAHVFVNTPARWICGQTNVIGESGEVIVASQFPVSYGREDVRAGLHDGRSLYVIQQEGCFWLRELYDEVGGINRLLKLAGDFDLWKRFATRTELLALSRPLASFRSRKGQLSAQMDTYYSEVESIQSRGGAVVDHGSEKNPDRPLFCLGYQESLSGLRQRPGPVCFLSEEGRIREIAYIRRGWYGPPAFSCA